MKTTKLPLYDYQREIVDFMVRQGSCINASFVGSGKTITSFGVADTYESTRNLVVAPKSVVAQWKDEGVKFMPEYEYFLVEGNAKERAEIIENALLCSKPYFLIISYEQARIEFDTLASQKWGCVFFDEGHRLVNPKTKTYKILKTLDCYRRYILTATPIQNSAIDMFGVMDFIRPGTLGNYWQFMNRYVIKDYWGSIKYFKNMDHLSEVCAPYIIRKSLEEVSLQLPPITQTDLIIQLSDKERKLYDQIKKRTLLDIEALDISKIPNPPVLDNTLTNIGKLFELCDSLELLGENTESSKLEMLKEHLENTLVNGNKAIIITRFSRMAEILTRELSHLSPLLITGQTSNRKDILDEFNNSPKHRLLVGTEAIGQGLNLQVANILYNYDLPWNPAKLEQREGRIYRNGQDKNTFVYNLLVDKSVDMWVKRKINSKESLSRKLLRDDIKEMLND